MLLHFTRSGVGRLSCKAHISTMNVPLPIRVLFRGISKQSGRGTSPEERLHSFHLNLGKWAIIVLCFLPPVLPAADLSPSCGGILVPSLQGEVCGLQFDHHQLSSSETFKITSLLLIDATPGCECNHPWLLKNLGTPPLLGSAEYWLSSTKLATRVAAPQE